MKDILLKIKELASGIDKNIRLMEVCGTHTQAVSRSGIRDVLPENIKLITGPGCPVCVTPQSDIDAIVSLALSGVPVATYGDVLRVPGKFGTLDNAREDGATVFDVYSTEDALKILTKHKDLVFFGLGFDTTTPMTAYAIKNGLTVYSTHKLFLPAMEALLKMGEVKIDGFIDPGHVSAIIGTKPYSSMNVAQVIAGFEAIDVLTAIYMLLKQIKDGRADVENQYTRVVRDEGNRIAYNLIFDVFDIDESDDMLSAGYWRGFGYIPRSGLRIKDRFSEFDAKIKYKSILEKIDFSKSVDPAGCACGEIIRGLREPKECPMFGNICTPDNPTGPCMVSVEGACNVSFRYK